jgi:outer membrane immunogenic protein
VSGVFVINAPMPSTIDRWILFRKWSNIRGTNQDQFNAPWTLTNNINWFGAATVRAGTAIYNPNILLYVKGGLAYAHEKLEIENSGVTLGTPSDVRIGWTAGAGLEWAFAPHLSAVIEGSYYGFGNKTETFNLVPGFINPPTTINVKPSFTTLSVGLNYRFGGP